jgi:signal peptidase I
MNFDNTVSDLLLAHGVGVRFRARGDSMYPSIRCGEHVEVEPVDAGDLRRGDVVLARQERGLTAHRVIRIERENGRVVSITTRGDNCDTDDGPFTPAELLGRIRSRKPRFLRWLMCAAIALIGTAAHATVITNPTGFGVARSWTLGAITDAQIKQQRDLAADAGLKIFVTEEGWQRVTNAAMLAAGFDPGDGSKLALYCAGIEQPLTVDAGGIGFYGIPLDTDHTAARTYWLRAKNGLRGKLARGKGGAALGGSVPFTVYRRDRELSIAQITNTEQNFFGPMIASWWVDAVQDLAVGNLDASYAGTATLEMTIQGSTVGAHSIAVNFAGHDLGNVSLDSFEGKTFTFDIPHSWLINGANRLTLAGLGGWEDVSLLSEVRLTYRHLLRADGGAFEANLPGGRTATIGGFTNANIRALDVTDPQRPSELETSVAGDPLGGYAATFVVPADSATRTILAVDATRAVTPAALALNRPSTWSAPNAKGADLVILTNPAFAAAAATLEPVRNAQGISTALVDVDDVYDEFNFGIRDPQAIRAFMQHASRWKRAPRWLLLVGDASIDPRNDLGMGSFDFVPTKTVPTFYLKTAMDDWFTDFNGDLIADIPVGRIPVRTAADATRIFNRLTARGTPTGAWADRALFVTDWWPDWDFAAGAAPAAAYLPSSFSQLWLGLDRPAILSALNDGHLLVNYLGHATTEFWYSAGLFTSADAAAMTNGDKLPFVVAMNCLNGRFHDVYTESVAEAFMKAPNGGAIAVWASSGLTEPVPQAAMNQELFRLMFSPENPTLGEAVARAKAVMNDPDVRKTWILFGDPSMRLR